MAELALILYGVYLGLAFGLRTYLQWRRTGSSGFHGLGGRPGSAEWLAGVGFAVALVMGAAAPVLALADLLEPIETLNGTGAAALGIVLAVGGISLTLYAQLAMGSSWRIGVDLEERTELVTHGPFALVRSPIFSAMIPTALGLTLMVPSVLAVAGFVALVVALELQVRVVEEPTAGGFERSQTRPADGCNRSDTGGPTETAPQLGADGRRGQAEDSGLITCPFDRCGVRYGIRDGWMVFAFGLHRQSTATGTRPSHHPAYTIKAARAGSSAG